VYDLPGKPASFRRPGPLPLRPAEVTQAIVDWAGAPEIVKEIA
jgi:2-oxoglutarate/2-oxoacid ferredoxin oxidoreductase subunit alpha